MCFEGQDPTVVQSSEQIRSRGSVCPSRVHFDSLCVVVSATALVVSLVGHLHPLANLQLLQSVLIHLPLDQEEGDDAGGESDHPEQHDS